VTVRPMSTVRGEAALTDGLAGAGAGFSFDFEKRPMEGRSICGCLLRGAAEARRAGGTQRLMQEP